LYSACQSGRSQMPYWVCEEPDPTFSLAASASISDQVHPFCGKGPQPLELVLVVHDDGGVGLVGQGEHLAHAERSALGRIRTLRNWGASILRVRLAQLQVRRESPMRPSTSRVGSGRRRSRRSWARCRRAARSGAGDVGVRRIDNVGRPDRHAGLSFSKAAMTAAGQAGKGEHVHREILQFAAAINVFQKYDTETIATAGSCMLNLAKTTMDRQKHR